MVKKSIFSILAFIFLTGFNYEICAIGSTAISERDISLRAQVSEIYYPGSGKNYVGLAQLIKGDLSLEILKSLGYKIDDILLDGEAKRIDDNTKAPEVLKKIKDVYGQDREAYLRTFVKIVYAERVLYSDIFLKSKEIHKEQYLKAGNFLKSVLSSPKSFKKVAKKIGLETATLKLSLKKGIMPYGDKRMKEEPGAGIDQAKRLIDSVSKIKKGEVYPALIEWSEGYQVIRLLKKEGEEFIIESASIPKRNYDEWYWGQAPKIPVKINDEALKQELLKEVSWARKLKLD